MRFNPPRLLDPILDIDDAIAVGKTEAMREVATMVPNWISEQVRRYQSVIESSHRLAQRGRFEMDDLVQIALDETAAIDLRADAITLFAASTEGNKGALRELLESANKVITTETLKRLREFRPAIHLLMRV